MPAVSQEPQDKNTAKATRPWLFLGLTLALTWVVELGAAFFKSTP